MTADDHGSAQFVIAVDSYTAINRADKLL